MYVEDDYLTAKFLAENGKKVIVLRKEWNVEFEKDNHSKNLQFAGNWERVGEIMQHTEKRTV